MMKDWQRYRVLVCGLLLLAVSGCCLAPVIPPRGVLYNDQKAPLFPGKELGGREGKASAHNILFLVGWGDASLHAAAFNGRITTIKYTDYRMFNILAIYQCYTTIVKGE